MARPLVRTILLLVVGALAVTGCGDDDATSAADETSSTTPAIPTATDDTTITTDPDPEPDPEPEHTVIEVAVRAGGVQGGGRTPVPLGETVTIRVTSDVDDHVHLHGYDVVTDVAAGETAELVFTADIPGVFEVELEDARIPLIELEIS